MARGAYAQTGDQSATTGSEGFDAAKGAAISAGPLTAQDILAIILGNSPLDVLLGRASPDVAETSALFGSPSDQTPYGPTGTTVGKAVQNNLYQAPGWGQIGLTRRRSGAVVQPGKNIDVTHYMVDRSNLPSELQDKATDVDAMTKAGYVPYIQFDKVLGMPGKMRWVHGGAAEVSKDTQMKDGFFPQTGATALLKDKLHNSDESAGKSNIGSFQTTATPVQLLTTLYALPQDELIRMQHKLWDGGYFQGTSRPAWGSADDATRDAYMAAMKDSLAHPAATFDETMASAGSRTMAQRSAGRKSKILAAEEAAQASTSATSKVMSEDQVHSIVDETAKELLGMNLSGDEIKRLTGIIQGRQTNDAQRTYDATKKSALAQAGVVPDEDLDRFVNLFNVEHADQFSGTVGHLGMRPKEWGSWLAKIGMDPTTPFTPATERTVFKELAADYYEQFDGNWADVATALLSGPGQGWADISHGLAPVQPGAGFGSSITDKATQIARQYTDGAGNVAERDAKLAAAGALQIQEDFDPRSFIEQETKRAHPKEYLGHEYLNRANDFMGMLGASVPTAGQQL